MKCKKCNNELISSGSFVEDNDGIITYRCTKCGIISKFDFCIAPVPMLIDLLDDTPCEFCTDVKYTHKKFKVLTQRGEIVDAEFNYCPVCGRDLRDKDDRSREKT